MNAYFEDIRARIKEEPTWYDANGTPRYGKFNPDMSPNIYASEIILMEISCQDCKMKFLVEMNWSVTDKVWDRHSESFFNRMRIWLKTEEDKKYHTPFHYGDPPSHGCVGDTMNCYDLRIVEFWKKEKFEWKRMEKYEIELEKEEE